jgi:FkbM family methyltransferase
MLNREFIGDVGPLPWAWRTAKRQFAKRALRRGVSLRLPTGLRMQIPPDSQSGTEVYTTKADIDWGAEAIFARHASGDFIDAGAHIGYYSLYLSPLVRRVYAFEPDPRCFAGLAANSAVGANITHVPLALSDRVGAARLDVSNASAVSRLSDSGSLVVEAITIDAFVACLNEPHIGVIKTDVEGHDLAVLEGARRTIIAHQPLILSEITPEAVKDFAGRLGYSLWAPRRHGRVKMTFLVPPRLAAEACFSP